MPCCRPEAGIRLCSVWGNVLPARKAEQAKRGLELANGVGIYFSLIANIGLVLGKQSEFINGERGGKRERERDSRNS